ncbi:hypothetical protein [Knoellia subterranea]|uniref:Transglycosylase SLT domain-containing protein n=1 Tax=Knoellia subterranea KCTC 19937 TaxID=1385521 RepID=A0A0A0JJY4_9MICO|nr:hypothetical protein [Knoellia subterranea]KGN37418.1 hypothetical protein N803_13520 [Knoellia subterranea KCTC 19937]
MSRYRGAHRGRHARPSEGPLAQALGVARRPAVTAGMALTLVGTGAMGAGATGANADAEPFTLSPNAMSLAALSAKETSADNSRISSERAGANAQRAAVNAKQEAEAKAKADAAAAAAKAQAEALAKARAAAAEKAARDKQRASIIANAKSDPRSAARELAASEYGWGDSQWRCLNLLWEGESSWRYTAENPSSGAYGIPQSLPARKMAKFGADYRSNPITQIKWGLWYIEASYGSPCNAWNKWQSRYPHWY